MKKIGIFIILILAFACPYFFCNEESRELDETSRKEAKGLFGSYNNGFVHYEISGDDKQTPTILVHGFAIPSVIWDKTFPFLSENGFQVIRYDLYGRGYSDRPNKVYNLQLFEEQLTDLIYALRISKKVNLIGVSMGGAIVVHYANKFPEKINKVVLIDPAGFPMATPLTAKLVKIPFLGEYIMNSLGERTLISGISANFRNSTTYPEIISSYQEQMKFKGFKRAILSTIRNMPLESLEDTYTSFGKKNIPTQVIWGMDDKVIPFENHKKVLESIPHAKFISIENAGHVPQYENPDIVNPAILEFLKGKND